MPLPPGTLPLVAPAGFQLAATARSHGWYDLPPFRWDAEGRRLDVVVRDGARAIDAAIVQRKERLEVTLAPPLPGGPARVRVMARVAEVLRLDEDLAPFYALADAPPRSAPPLAWARRLGAGRLLRAPTAFEDAIKMLLTTNCSWSLTRQMVGRLVDELGGAPAPSGRRAFPTAEALAARPERWYRDVARVGYRAPFVVELARRVAAGEIDLEAPRHAPVDGAALRDVLLGLPGIGPYAADNLLRLYGAYDRLGLDSWCRAQLKEILPRARKLDDAAVRRYAGYGRWAGLAMWLEITRRWHEPDAKR